VKFLPSIKFLTLVPKISEFLKNSHYNALESNNKEKLKSRNDFLNGKVLAKEKRESRAPVASPTYD
jgi:hypothetical protein